MHGSPQRPLDVCIVHYGAPDELARCLRSVRRHLPGEQVRVWDNPSERSGQVRLLAEEHPDVDWTFSDVGLGFAGGANRLVDRSANDTLLLNPDAELTGPLSRARAALAGNRVAAVSPTVVDPSGRAERWDVAHRRQTAARVLVNRAGYAGRLRGTPFSDLYRQPPGEVDGYITGCSLLVAREAWNDVGPLDERFFVYGEDPDWQQRARGRGWRLLLVDEPEVRHGDEPGGPHDPSTRMEDLLAANTALALGMRGGRGPGAAVIAGDVLLERLQRSRRRRRSRAVGRAAGGLPSVLVVASTLDPGSADHRVQVANELSEAGHPVTVVCLRALGSLERTLRAGVRIVLRPWWLPVVDTAGEAVLLSGTASDEVAFAAAWQRAPSRHRRRWLVVAHDPAELVSRRSPLRAAAIATCDGIVRPGSSSAAGSDEWIPVDAPPGELAAAYGRIIDRAASR